jgi:fumarate reductase subunit C
MPSTWWGERRILTYLLFDATGVVYYLISFLAIGMIQALARGPESWDAQMQRLQHPFYIAFHVLCLVSVVFVAIRFFRLFPKAQPKAIGPIKPPPAGVIQATLYVVWFAITAVMTAVLAGVIF